jgi:epoxide hydrolase 4
LPALTECLIILNCPHPTGITRELAHNPQQQEQSAYAREFQKEDAHKLLTPESLSTWVKDSRAREHYLEAFRRSEFEAMLHYHKQNYPRPPYHQVYLPTKVQAPVLQIHDLQDQFLLPGALNSTWEWLENDWTLLIISQAGHFVQHDAAQLVTNTFVNWLANTGNE